MNGTALSPSNQSAYIDDFSTHHQRLGIAYLVLSFFGVFGNMLTLLSICTSKRLQTIPNVYVANLALMDFVISISMTLSPAYYAITGKNFPHCEIFGFVSIYCIACSRLHLCCIAVNRYILIVRGMKMYTKVYKRSKVVITLVLSYVIPLVILIGAVTKRFSSFTYNSVVMNCFFQASSYETYWYILGIMETSFFMPALGLTITLYALIIRKFQKVRRNVVDGGPVSSSDSDRETIVDRGSMVPTDVKSSVQMIAKNVISLRAATSHFTAKISISREKKCVLNLVVVFVVFILCWSPLCFVLMADYYFTVSPVVFSLLLLLGASNSALNVFLYAVMNEQFRRAYKSLLSFKCLRRSS